MDKSMIKGVVIGGVDDPPPDRHTGKISGLSRMRRMEKVRKGPFLTIAIA